MLEIILAGGKSGRYFPDSGPGSKLLIAGTKEYGYFGEVTETEMGLNNEFNRLLDQTGATERTIGVVTNTWFKFVLKGKFLFFPKFPLAGVMPLKDLYAMRAIIDADDQLKYPTDITTSQPVYQQNLHIANPTNELFKVRTFDQFPDVAQSPNVTNYVTPAATSEIAMLFMALHIGSPHPDTLKIKKYAWTDFANVGANSYGHFYTQDIGPNSNPLQSSHISQYLQTYWVAANSSYAWRPVLQYIPVDQKAGLLLGPDNLNVSNEGMPAQVAVTGTATSELSALTFFSNVVETQAVAPSGQADQFYAIAPTGGFATTENDTPGTVSATTDSEQYLYQMDGGVSDEYSGYVTAS